MEFEQPDIVPIPGPWWRYQYRVRTRWLCQWTGRDGQQYRFWVEPETRTDGSTEWVIVFLGILPGFAIQLFGIAQDGLHRGAVVGHDAGYEVTGELEYEVFVDGVWVKGDRPLTRAEIDWLMLDVARQAGVRWFRRWPKYLGVLPAGYPVWAWRRLKRWWKRRKTRTS